MSPEAPYCNSFRSFFPEQLNSLIRALHRRNYEVFGPTIRDGAIVYDQILSAEDLPRGWTDEQQAGKYQLHKRSRETLFGYAVGPHSWKKFLFPSVACVWTAQRVDGHFRFATDEQEPAQFAFLGVRACDLRALQFRTESFWKMPMSIAVIEPAGRMSALLPSIARKREERVSAIPWKPARK